MAMNLAQYAQMPKGQGGEFLKWTQSGETKILRFLYTSRDGADIEVVKKEWDDAQKKYVYDTPGGKLTCVLDCVLYEPGKAPRKVRWERSANFTEQVCNGYWAKFPRIIDGVWEVTCLNPGTKDIKFSWFPVMGADFTTYPLPEGISIENGSVVYAVSAQASAAAPSNPAPQVSSVAPSVATVATNESVPPTIPRKYWE